VLTVRPKPELNTTEREDEVDIEDWPATLDFDPPVQCIYRMAPKN